MSRATNRRQFLKDAAAVGAAVAALRTVDVRAAAPGVLPTIKLGDLTVSRLILGSNPFFGFAHGNPQATGREMETWYTPQRIMAVMDSAAEHGITAVWTPCYDRWVKLWNEYRERGGKLATWIAQPDQMPMEKAIDTAVKHGAAAVAIQGMRIDEHVGWKRWDRIRSFLERIKGHGLPAGMATHRADTHLIAEEKGMPTDFYHQTLYRPDNFVPQGLEESLRTIEKLDKPVVGYKALGAGRIAPKDALPQVFKRLKPQDGICIGMFPRDRDEVAENSSLCAKLG